MRGGASMLPAISVATQSAKPVCTTLKAGAGMASSRRPETKLPRDLVSACDMVFLRAAQCCRPPTVAEPPSDDNRPRGETFPLSGAFGRLAASALRRQPPEAKSHNKVVAKAR